MSIYKIILNYINALVKANYIELLYSFMLGGLLSVVFLIGQLFSKKEMTKVISIHINEHYIISIGIIILVTILLYTFLMILGNISFISMLEIFGLILLIGFKDFSMNDYIKVFICYLFFSRISYKINKNFKNNKYTDIISMIQLILPYIGILF